MLRPVQVWTSVAVSPAQTLAAEASSQPHWVGGIPTFTANVTNLNRLCIEGWALGMGGC